MIKYVIEVRKKNKWGLLVEIAGRLHSCEISTIFVSQKDAEKYARDYFNYEDDSFVDSWRVSSIEPIEVSR